MTIYHYQSQPNPSLVATNTKFLSFLLTTYNVQLLCTMISTYTSIVPNRDLHISSSGFTTILLEKLRDLNARTKEGSFETLLFLASKKEIGIQVLSGPFLKLPKNQVSFRTISYLDIFIIHLVLDNILV